MHSSTIHPHTFKALQDNIHVFAFNGRAYLKEYKKAKILRFIYSGFTVSVVLPLFLQFQVSL